MNFVLNLGNSEHLELVIKTPIREVVIQTSSFSLCGRISNDELHSAVEQLNSHGKIITLQWDTLCHDREIEYLSDLFATYSDHIPTVRFVDPGVGLYLKNHFPKHQLQFLMWDGHQNRAGILKWIQVFQPVLNRVILSNQIPGKTIQRLRQDTQIHIEIKGLGRMQLFYSPRKLLHSIPQLALHEQADIAAVSADRPSQFFAVNEIRQGTVIYNDKDLWLLDELKEIEKIGLDYLGIELCTIKQYQWLKECFGKPDWIETLRKAWINPTTRGFFKQNQTDELLARLTNVYIKDEKQYQIGAVLESLKNAHTLLHLQQDLVLPQQVVFVTPERKIVHFEVVQLYDLKGILYKKKAGRGFYRLPWIKYVVPASIMKSNASF